VQDGVIIARGGARGYFLVSEGDGGCGAVLCLGLWCLWCVFASGVDVCGVDVSGVDGCHMSALLVKCIDQYVNKSIYSISLIPRMDPVSDNLAGFAGPCFLSTSRTRGSLRRPTSRYVFPLACFLFPAMFCSVSFLHPRVGGGQ
jgi:hypothetical protein